MEDLYNTITQFVTGSMYGVVLGRILICIWNWLHPVSIYKDGYFVSRAWIRHHKIDLQKYRDILGASGRIVLKRHYAIRHAGDTIFIVLSDHEVKVFTIPIRTENIEVQLFEN